MRSNRQNFPSAGVAARTRWTIAVIVVLEYYGCFLLRRLDSFLQLKVMGPAPLAARVKWPAISSALFRLTPSGILPAIFVVAVLVAAIWGLAPGPASPRTKGVAVVVLAASMVVLAHALGVTLNRMPFLELVLASALVLGDAALRRLAFGAIGARSGVQSIRVLVGVLLIAAYSGLYLSATPLTVAAAIPITLAVCAVLAMRAHYFWRLNERQRSLRDHLLILAIILIAATILLMSYFEYANGTHDVAFAPLGQPWRAMYFGLVVSIYVLVPCLWLYEDQSSSLRTSITPTVLTGAMMVIIPFLTCFTPHGVVLLLVSSVWLAIAYVVSRTRFGTQPKGDYATVQFWCCLVVLLLFGFLAFDRLAYYSVLRSIAPTMPVLALIPPVLGGLLALVAAFSSSFRGFAAGIWVVIRSSRHTPRIGLKVLTDAAILVISVFMLLVYVMCYAVLKSALDTSGPMPQPTVGVPGISGFFGLNTLSWVSLSYILNIAVVLGVLGWERVSDKQSITHQEQNVE